jgi:hypothetical protein
LGVERACRHANLSIKDDLTHVGHYLALAYRPRQELDTRDNDVDMVRRPNECRVRAKAGTDETKEGCG